MKKVFMTPNYFNDEIALEFDGTKKSKKRILKSDFYKTLCGDLKKDIEAKLKEGVGFCLWECKNEFTEEFYEKKLKNYITPDAYESEVYLNEDNGTFVFRNIETLARKARKEGKIIITNSAFYNIAWDSANTVTKENPTYYILSLLGPWMQIPDTFYFIDGTRVDPLSENCPEYLTYLRFYVS